MIDCTMNGERIDADWTGTIATGSVELIDLNTSVAAKGTQEAIDAAKKELENGTRFVFADFTYGGGKTLTADLLADVNTDDKYTPDTKIVEEKNGKLVFMESKFRAAPYFELRVDGIEELQNAAN